MIDGDQLTLSTATPTIVKIGPGGGGGTIKTGLLGGTYFTRYNDDKNDQNYTDIENGPPATTMTIKRTA